MERGERPDRRRRVADRIDVNGPSHAAFDPAEWAEDFAIMLETHKLKHAKHMDSPTKQRQKATAVLKIVGHHLNQHPDLRRLDWSDMPRGCRREDADVPCRPRGL